MYTFFQGLFQYLITAITSDVGWIGTQLQSILTWFGSEMGGMFSAFTNFFGTLLQPVLYVFNGFYYLLQQVFSIVVLVIQLIFGLFNLVLAVITGIFSTFGQLLSYSGSTSYYHIPNAYQMGFGFVTQFMNTTGMNEMANIMSVFIWILTAYAVIKIAGGER